MSMHKPVAASHLYVAATFRPLAAVCLLLAALCCYAQEEEQAEKTRNFLEEEHALSMEFETKALWS